MTEPTEAPVPATDAEGAEVTHRGRPRPATTIQRDEEVAGALAEKPLTRDEIASKLNMGKNHVYLSLHRLKTSGRVQRVRSGSSHTWELTGASAPTAPEGAPEVVPAA